MPTEFFYIIALLVVAIIFGYFYLKRAQARTPNADASAEKPAESSERSDTAS